ncbi:putative reverse transcriptase domain-containing protein [Tanacetum coccineum]
MLSRSRLLLKLTHPQYVVSSPLDTLEGGTGELIDRKESTTNLKRLLKERPRMGYQIEASMNVHNSAILEDSLPPNKRDPGNMEEVILFYKGLDVPTRQILDSREIRASTDAAIRNQEASIKALEIQIGQMSKVLQERMQIFKPNQSVIPFPNRLIDDSYEESDVLKELIKLHINSIESTSNLKRLLNERPRMGYQNEVSMNIHDSAILKDSLPPKEKDPGSFTIPCYINTICFEKALADLGASISVMPYSTFTNLGLGELASTKLIIKLADRTIKCPKDIAENVLVGIDKFVFHVDFIFLDIPKDI